MTYPELQKLVDAPRERVDIEYRSWLNMDDREVQAGVASRLCAIANHGGGFVVFGIAKDMRSTGPQPPDVGPYDQDRLWGIVRRYLIPLFQVTVYWIAAWVTSKTYSVVRVPSHEAVQGDIQSIRTAGPFSVQRRRS